MLNNIPHNRLVIYILICGLIPILIAVMNVFSKLDDLDTLKLHMEQVSTQAFIREKRQATNMAVQSAFRDTNHFYLDKEIESIHLLKPEIDSLMTIVNNPNFTEDEAIKRRLELLTGSGNELVFSEGIVQSTPLFQEVTETLVHPVEINLDDLKNLLAKIEGKDIGPFKTGEGRPQLMIIDFKIDKKNTLDKNEAYLLNLKLLKREFL